MERLGATTRDHEVGKRRSGARVARRLPRLAAMAILLALPAAAGAEEASATVTSAPDDLLVTRRPLSLGLVGVFSMVPGGSYPDGVTLGGIRVGYALDHRITVGITDLMVSGADTLGETRWGTTLGPYVEYGRFAASRFQVFGQLGVPAQLRTGAGQGAAVGFAPFLAAGFRYWAIDMLSLGLEARAQIVASEAYVTSSRVLPRGAVPTAAGMNLEFHL